MRRVARAGRAGVTGDGRNRRDADPVPVAARFGGDPRRLSAPPAREEAAALVPAPLCPAAGQGSLRSHTAWGFKRRDPADPRSSGPGSATAAVRSASARRR
ncbi:hypothetical protein GCM10010964_30490 [Caldovatus sediminis]|uniref:Uncharacterized protein n=1 Tax=Caldovatus sediminis TaxID=2041189 RepID=A0A8J2ZDB4_9PROT|nr:hypothetical protein GCM10010964_30490 [Caldovatus sediminis]